MAQVAVGGESCPQFTPGVEQRLIDRVPIRAQLGGHDVERSVVENDRDAVPDVWAAYAGKLGRDASEFGYVRRDRDAVSALAATKAARSAGIAGSSMARASAPIARALITA